MANATFYLPGAAKNDSSQHHLVPDAVVRGAMLFTGGVAPVDADGKFKEAYIDQVAVMFDRMESLLAQVGYSWDDAGHVFFWAPDRHEKSDRDTYTKVGAINPHWARVFPDIGSRPARHVLARALDPGLHYRMEIVAVKNAKRKSFEIGEGVYHTGGTQTPGFIPFGTNAGDLGFTGPTFGMFRNNVRKLPLTAAEQARLVDEDNREYFKLSGHTQDNVAQIFMWCHSESSRAATIKYANETMFPDPNDRPALHYIAAPLPYWPEVDGQFLIQEDAVAVKGALRKTIVNSGVVPKDADAGVPAGVAIGNLCYTSVCLGNDGTGALAGSLAEQAERAFANVKTIVEAGGFKPSDIGHLHVWYGDIVMRDAVDAAYAKAFPDPELRPSHHCVPASLPEGALVGVEAIAAR